MERICRNCEYFDAHYGDCLNRLSPRFQTTAEQTCEAFYPDSTLEESSAPAAPAAPRRAES